MQNKPNNLGHQSKGGDFKKDKFDRKAFLKSKIAASVASKREEETAQTDNKMEDDDAMGTVPNLEQFNEDQPETRND